MESVMLEPLFLANFGGIGNILIVTVVILLASFVLEGIWVKGFISALIVAVVVAVVNMLIGGFLNALVSPIRWLPFEAAYILVDAVIIYIADFFLKGFKIKNFWSALTLVVIISIVQWIL